MALLGLCAIPAFVAFVVVFVAAIRATRLTPDPRLPEARLTRRSTRGAVLRARLWLAAQAPSFLRFVLAAATAGFTAVGVAFVIFALALVFLV